MPSKTRPYSEFLLERLANPEVAMHYLNAALEESPEDFLKAFGKVAQASLSNKMAKGDGVQGETLCRSLSEQGNPTFATLSNVLATLGLGISITLKDADRVPITAGDEKGVAEEASV